MIKIVEKKINRVIYIYLFMNGGSIYVLKVLAPARELAVPTMHLVYI